jgi:multicomponent Na+:H+ antiporter subunit D
MAIPLFSVVGIPPLSGFWPKISFVLAAFDVKQYWALGAILLGSFLTLYIIGVLWIEVFWKQRKKEPDQVDFLYYKNLLAKDKFSLVFPLVLLGAVSLYIGFGAESIQKLSQQIAKDLIHPETYIRAVLP